MREIKFRAWDIQNKAMYYDSEYSFETGGRDGYLTVRDLDGYIVIGNSTTTMQYTGLKDKNGKEIYEGDILKGRNIGDYDYSNYRQGITPSKKYKISEVKWNNEPAQENRYGWEPFNFYSTNGCNDYDDDYYDVGDCKVIGNIYENPELLNAKKV